MGDKSKDVDPGDGIEHDLVEVMFDHKDCKLEDIHDVDVKCEESGEEADRH